MQLFLIPVIVLLLPVTILFFLLKFFSKSKEISIPLKFALGSIFIIFGIMTSIFAMTISIEGMMHKGIKCATGAVTFVLLGFMVYLIGVPLMLILFRKADGKR